MRLRGNSGERPSGTATARRAAAAAIPALGGAPLDLGRPRHRAGDRRLARPTHDLRPRPRHHDQLRQCRGYRARPQRGSAHDDPLQECRARAGRQPRPQRRQIKRRRDRRDAPRSRAAIALRHEILGSSAAARLQWHLGAEHTRLGRLYRDAARRAAERRARFPRPRQPAAGPRTDQRQDLRVDGGTDASDQRCRARLFSWGAGRGGHGPHAVRQGWRGVGQRLYLRAAQHADTARQSILDRRRRRATIGTQGLQVETETLQTLLSGAIVFETPPDALAEAESPPGSKFTLYRDRKSAADSADPVRVSYQVSFPGPLHGLAIGTPVELRGIPIGRVSALRLEYDRASEDIRVPATIEISPHRIAIPGETPIPRDDPKAATEATNRLFERLIAKGLRARLAPDNLLIGSRIVDLEFIENPTPAQLGQTQDRKSVV